MITSPSQWHMQNIQICVSLKPADSYYRVKKTSKLFFHHYNFTQDDHSIKGFQKNLAQLIINLQLLCQFLKWSWENLSVQRKHNSSYSPAQLKKRNKLLCFFFQYSHQKCNQGFQISFAHSCLYLHTLASGGNLVVGCYTSIMKTNYTNNLNWDKTVLCVMNKK